MQARQRVARWSDEQEANDRTGAGAHGRQRQGCFDDGVRPCSGGAQGYFEAAIAAGARGIVSAGFAPGMTSPVERAVLVEAAAAGVVVVQASRVGSGRVSRRQWLRRQGWVGADDLSPHKARILLMLALMHSSDPDWIQTCFDTY